MRPDEDEGEGEGEHLVDAIALLRKEIRSDQRRSGRRSDQIKGDGMGSGESMHFVDALALLRDDVTQSALVSDVKAAGGGGQDSLEVG